MGRKCKQGGVGERRGCGCTQTGREKIGAEIERDDVIRERREERERKREEIGTSRRIRENFCAPL